MSLSPAILQSRITLEPWFSAWGQCYQPVFLGVGGVGQRPEIVLIVTVEGPGYNWHLLSKEAARHPTVHRTALARACLPRVVTVLRLSNPKVNCKEPGVTRGFRPGRMVSEAPALWQRLPMADLVLRQLPVAAVTGDHTLGPETMQVGRATLLQADVSLCPFWRPQGTVCSLSFLASGGFPCSLPDGSLPFSFASQLSRLSDRCGLVTAPRAR